MKKRKNSLKKFSRFLGKYINGMKGAVSLLLVLTLSPMLSIALILVESARYQNAVELMEEITDSSAFSTLADYDSFLDERFGLLSVSQERNIDTAFGDYIGHNISALGKSVTIDSQKASGAFALSDIDILKQQLLEYSEISVAAEVVAEGINLDDILEELQKKLNVEEIRKEMDAVSACADFTEEIAGILKSINDVQKQYGTYSDALKNYKEKYEPFEMKALALAAAANESDGEEEDGEEEDAEEDKVSIYAEKEDYKTAAETLKTELTELKNEIDGIISAINNLPTKLQKFDKARSKLESKSELELKSEADSAGEDTTSTYEWIKIVAGETTNTFKNIIGENFDVTIEGEIQALKDQITKLGMLEDEAITSAWTQDTIKAEYGCVSILSIGDSFLTGINRLISSLNEKASVGMAGFASMGSFLDIANQLLDIKCLYDTKLNAAVSESGLYTNSRMALSSKISVSALTELIGACEIFWDGIRSLNIYKAMIAAVKLMAATVIFLAAVISWVLEIGANFFTLTVSGPKEWYNSLLLYGYGAYNLPNRTNYDSGRTVSDYPYKKVYQLAGGSGGNDAVTGALRDFAPIGDETGTDEMFKGAEAEYVLVGSTSELQNQGVAFFNLYMLRLVLDFWAVWKNPEVSAVAAVAGPGSLLVKLAVVLAEPMLDSLILVNGGEEYLFKKTVYLTVTGLPDLMEDLNDIASISENLKGKIKDAIKGDENSAAGTDKGASDKKKKDRFDASYTEHMLLLTLLSVNQTTFMRRIQNLIQMEAAANSQAFDLDKAYTYIYSDVKYTLNPMFNIDSLTKNGLFTATRRQYSGY